MFVTKLKWYLVILGIVVLYDICVCFDDSTVHTVNVWPWAGNPFTWEGKCTFNVPSGVTVWTLNLTFDRTVSNFVVYHADVISYANQWQCLESKFYLNAPYTEYMTFQGEFYGSSTAPTGGCYLLWDQAGTCPYGGTTTTSTTTTTTTTTTPAPTTTTTTLAPTTTTLAPTTTATTTTAPTTTTTTTTAPPTTTTTMASTTSTTISTLIPMTTTLAQTTTTTHAPTTTTTTAIQSTMTAFDNSLLSTFEQFRSSLVPSATTLVTDSPTSTESDTCYCFFVSGTVSDDIFAERIRNLTVDRHSVSASVRKRNSAADDRTSAKSIGILGGLSLAVVFGFFILCDVINLLNYMGVLT